MTISDDEISEMLDAERLARRTKVMFLRNGGVTWAKVAAEVGVSEKTARKDYELVCRDINNEDPAHVVARHRAQIYDVCRAMYPRMMGSNFEDASRAAIVILRAQERESKLLGLDSPVRVMATLSNEDFATEAARLITSIQQLDASTLKELSSAGAQPAIDAEVIEPEPEPAAPEHGTGEPTPVAGLDGDTGEPEDHQPTAEHSGGHGTVIALHTAESESEGDADAPQSIQQTSEPSGPDGLPDSDDDWSNL